MQRLAESRFAWCRICKRIFAGLQVKKLESGFRITIYRITMRKLVPVLLAFIGLLFGANAQNVEFIKKNFKDDKGGFRKAMDSMNVGDQFYSQGVYMYHYALPYYLTAENFNPNNDKLNYKIGQCLLNSPFKT